MKKILSVIGARPQFIKASVVSKALMKAGLDEVIAHTGQHYDFLMSSVFWEELQLPDLYANLEIGSDSHGRQTALIIEKVEALILKLKPDALMVYGDTNSTLGAAIAASKIPGIKIVHIESGLRSFNRNMPEEVNRVLTDHVSDYLFCSSDEGVRNLAKEGISKHVYNVGDVMHDCIKTFMPIRKKIADLEDVLNKAFGLMTIHRPSNTDNPANMLEIFKGVEKIGVPVIWPLHPRNRNLLSNWKMPSNIKIINPASYLEMLFLLDSCEFVITDSGGLQKEAYWMNKACITVRDETEWVETLSKGANTLTGPNSEKIYQAFNSRKDAYWESALYGDGHASEAIANILLKEL